MERRLLVYGAFMERAIKGLPKVLMAAVHELYFLPKYEEFAARTLWSLSNAFTSSFKRLTPIKQFEVPAKLGSCLATSPGHSALKPLTTTDAEGAVMELPLKTTAYAGRIKIQLR